VKKLIIVLLMGLFVLGGGEKIFGFEKSAHAKIILGGLEMKSDDFALMKGFVYRAIQEQGFDKKMKAKCAEVLVWATYKLMDKKSYDLTSTNDSLSQIFRAIVGDIGTFFNNPNTPVKIKKQRSSKWLELGKKVVVKFVRITVKSKSSGQVTTQVEWDISIPKPVKVKKK
jgi:hypothetical protein